MKTPREILLARHQAVEPRLDEIRRAFVAGFSPHPAPETENPLALRLWRELIWPCRRTWAGLAAAWLVILLFNYSHADGNPSVGAKSSRPPGEMRLALREQRRVLEELIGPGPAASTVEPPRRPNNQPRSERRGSAMA